jgi:hypothetical protein
MEGAVRALKLEATSALKLLLIMDHGS